MCIFMSNSENIQKFFTGLTWNRHSSSEYTSLKNINKSDNELVLGIVIRGKFRQFFKFFWIIILWGEDLKLKIINFYNNLE